MGRIHFRVKGLSQGRKGFRIVPSGMLGSVGTTKRDGRSKESIESANRARERIRATDGTAMKGREGKGREGRKEGSLELKLKKEGGSSTSFFLPFPPGEYSQSVLFGPVALSHLLHSAIINLPSRVLLCGICTTWTGGLQIVERCQ